MNTIFDEKKTTKNFILLILLFAVVSTAQQVIRVISANGIHWYSCPSECIVISITDDTYFVAGTGVHRIESPNNNNENSSSGSSGSGSGSGGEPGSGGGTGSGGYYNFRPMGGGSAAGGSICSGGTSMNCNAERCVVTCHQE